MNLKKIFIFTLLIWTLASCSDNIAENISQTPVDNPQVITEQKVKKTNLKTVWISEFKKELAKNDWILIDLRTDWEVAEWVISWAKQIDFYASDFKNKVSQLDKSKKYLIYCRSWARSWKTLNLMKNLWFTNVYELRWWMNNWLRNWEKTAKLWEIISSSEMNDKIITLNAKNWEFDKKVIRVKKWEKVKIKVNNLDWLHWIAIPEMKLMDDNEIEIDTSKAWEFKFQCLNYCWDWHSNMTWKIIIE